MLPPTVVVALPGQATCRPPACQDACRSRYWPSGSPKPTPRADRPVREVTPRSCAYVVVTSWVAAAIASSRTTPEPRENLPSHRSRSRNGTISTDARCRPERTASHTASGCRSWLNGTDGLDIEFVAPEQKQGIFGRCYPQAARISTGHYPLSWLVNGRCSSQMSSCSYRVTHSRMASMHIAIHKMPRVACTPDLDSSYPPPSLEVRSMRADVLLV